MGSPVRRKTGGDGEGWWLSAEHGRGEPGHGAEPAPHDGRQQRAPATPCGPPRCHGSREKPPGRSRHLTRVLQCSKRQDGKRARGRGGERTGLPSAGAFWNRRDTPGKSPGFNKNIHRRSASTPVHLTTATQGPVHTLALCPRCPAECQGRLPRSLHQSWLVAAAKAVSPWCKSRHMSIVRRAR